jgi:molybdate transport system ATP-binding protein
MVCPKSDLYVEVRQAGPIPLSAELRCEGGQLLVLVGPSGSGKSTLLRMIAGLARPPSRRIVYGKDTWFDAESGIFVPPQGRRIGYVSQHYGLFPHMTAIDNVRAGLHHLSRVAQHRRAGEWLARMHLDGLALRRPAELSGGQQQRVAVARALARGPSVLLLDEPFSSVDRATREQLYSELAELKRHLSIPVVMVTHDLNEALLLADRLTLLTNGRTLQSGAPREVMARPAGEAAARLVGILNVFDGKIVGHDARRDCTSLLLGPHLLASPYRPDLVPGTRVRWAIPNAGVRFRAIVHADLPASRNRLDITVTRALTLGDKVQLTAEIDSVRDVLYATIPLRLANELAIVPGRRTTVVLREEDIHVLPPDPTGASGVTRRHAESNTISPIFADP